MKSLGLLAGKGDLPLEFLKIASERRKEIVVFALEGITDKRVETLSSKVFWIKPFKLGKLIKSLKTSRIKELAVLGKIEHRTAFSLKNLDLAAAKILLSVKSKRPEELIKRVFREIEKAGVEIIDPTPYLKHLLPERGILVGNPSERVIKDVRFGMQVAKKVASLDIGQTVVVKEGAVIAVEGVEGTDECIKRGASLAGEGFVVCKAAREKQDMRIDVPTVGIETVKLVASLGGKAIAVEAGRTFLLERNRLLEEALKKKISVLAL